MRKWNYCSSLVLLLCLSFSIELEAVDISNAKNLSVESVSQTRDVVLKGKVTDKEGNELPGASILVDGTTVGTVTDINGDYSLRFVPKPNQKLIFSFVGLRTQAILYTNQKVLNVVLEAGDVSLDDVVVIGYGSKNRKSLTSSISSIDKKEVERLAATTTSVDNLLGGTVKGVLSTQSSGEPGATIKINVRGITSPYPPSGSMNDNNVPLYVIDGVPIFIESNALNPLLSLSPNDIESIDVLKDASATAIYGSRGANGVIIVKTKNGRKGEKVSVDAGYTFSVGNAIKEYLPLNNGEFRNLQNEILSNTADYVMQNGGIMNGTTYAKMSSLGLINATYDDKTRQYTLNSYDGLNDKKFGSENTNWVKEIKNKNATTHQYNVSIRGGSEKSNYSFSLNALNQEGIFINDKLDRYGARLAVDTEITRRVKVGGALNYSFGKRNCGSMEQGYGLGIDAWRVRPDIPVYDENGDFKRYDASPANGYPVAAANPVAVKNLKSDFDSHQFTGNAYMDVDIVKGLKLHADINIATYSFENSYFTPSSAQDINSGRIIPAMIQVYNSRSTYTSINFRADYNLTVRKHHLAVMAGYGSDRSFNSGKSLSAMDFANENILNNIGSANTFWPISDSYLKSGLNSVYSRISYDYDTRYLLELSLRADASSKFGPDNKWGVFPAVSLGWRVNKESFLKDFDKLDDLKLRMSFGKTGSTNVADFSYLQYFNKGDSYGKESSVVLKTNLPNQKIHWEMTTEYNLGVDFSLFNHRLFGSMDLYHRYTAGSLVPSPYVLESGMEEFTSNLLDMTNRGIEFEIGGDIIRNKDFVWTSSFNIAANRNKIKRLNGASISTYMQDSFVEGMPAGTKKGYKVVKIIQDQSEIEDLNKRARSLGRPYYQDVDTGVGDYLFFDMDGSGYISNEDRTVIVNPEPKFFGGWDNVLTYKGVSLSFLMQFTEGGEALYAAVRGDSYGNLGQSISRETFENTWTSDRTNAKYQRLVANRSNTYWMQSNDRSVFKTSYLRMKNVTLSYTIPTKALNRIHLQNSSVFATITNLFTISQWPGLDPELVGSSVTSMGENNDPYPMSRTFSLGVRFQF